MRFFLSVLCVTALGGALAACSGMAEHRVQQVVDGDTLVLAGGDRVRLIGVDTPETKHPDVPVQYFGKEASAFTRKWLEGRVVRLEYGPDPRDKYGRLLAYVWVDGVDFNREIIRRGYAVATTRFEHARRDDFLQAEREARARRYGMWHDSPTTGRVANLIRRWDGLSPEGKALLDEEWDDLLESHPSPAVDPAPEPAP
jgi:micrococcal nuclease